MVPIVKGYHTKGCSLPVNETGMRTIECQGSKLSRGRMYVPNGIDGYAQAVFRHNHLKLGEGVGILKA